MDHSFKSISGEFLELFEILAPIDRKNWSVGINEFFGIFSFIDEKSSRHVRTKLFNKRKRLFIKFETIICHCKILRLFINSPFIINLYN